MSPLQAQQLAKASPATRTIPVNKPHRTPPPTRPAPDWSCMVLSPAESRLEAMSRGARRAGWNPIDCLSTEEAVRQDRRWRTQLALVDMDGNRSAQEYIDLVSGRSDLLLMICDERPTGESETWARQAGAWLYLPEPQLGEELVELCSEALRICKSRVGANAPSSVH